MSAAIAFVLVVAQLVRSGHMVFVAHDRCAQHGELVHVDRDHGEGARDEASPPATSSEPAVTTSESGSHEHCDVPALKHTLADLTSPCPELTLLDGYVLPWSVRPRAAEPVVDLLFLAPKSSPPVSL